MHPLKRRVVAGLCLCWLVVSPAAAQVDKPFETAPVKGIDEPLFLMRALETTYQRWPRNTTNQRLLQDWLVHSRAQLTKLRTIIEVKELDKDIAKMYDDCLKLQAVYETYLLNLGAIDRATLAQLRSDNVAVNKAALSSGWDAAKSAGQDKDGDPLVAGAFSAIVSGAIEDYQRTKARNAAKRSALEAERRKVDRAWQTARARAEILAEQVAQRHGWKEGEAGFDGFTSKTFGPYFARRPRDPFLHVWYAKTGLSKLTPVQVMSNAKRCLRAAREVPAGRAYDPYRVEFVTTATDLAVLAATRQLADGAYSGGPAEYAPDAIRFCKTLAELDPADAAGHVDVQLARALASAGQYKSAVSAANRAVKKNAGLKSDVGFAYRYARLMSLTDKAKLAGDWLEHAYRLGWSDVKFVRKDKDLAKFKAADPKRFRKLTTPNSSYHVKFGIINDDIVFTNKSPFALTNIQLDVIVRKGSRVWRPKLKLGRLRPGASHTFSNVFSIPGSKYDKISAILRTDQHR